MLGSLPSGNFCGRNREYIFLLKAHGHLYLWLESSLKQLALLFDKIKGVQSVPLYANLKEPELIIYRQKQDNF